MGNGSNMKSRYLAAAISLVLILFFMLALAANADALLSAERGAASLNPAKQLARALSSRRCLLMWLLLDGIGILGIYWALFGRSYLDYHSEMYEVVPGFEIPMPEGQGQHGTAWWLPETDYSRVFNAAHTGEGVMLTRRLEERYVSERECVDNVE